jgi:hypothetical protein
MCNLILGMNSLAISAEECGSGVFDVLGIVNGLAWVDAGGLSDTRG